jgi:fumarate reductase flavoprotein subunit
MMWDEVGIIRTSDSLQRGLAALDGLEADLLATGVDGSDPAFNLTWHDWLNLRSQIEASRAITLAATARRNSRGAHYREDFPDEGDMVASTYTLVRREAGRDDVSEAPVKFTRIEPGKTLIKDAPAAAE